MTEKDIENAEKGFILDLNDAWQENKNVDDNVAYDIDERRFIQFNVFSHGDICEIIGSDADYEAISAFFTAYGFSTTMHKVGDISRLGICIATDNDFLDSLK